MNSDKFNELINLYLDKEISDQQLAVLKRELEANAERRDLFSERVRLDKAMRMALAPASADRLPIVATKAQFLLASGIAATLLVAAVMIGPLLRQTSHPGDQHSAAHAQEVDMELAELRHDDLRRFERLREQRVRNRASLAAHMRLMGLRPELTPEDKQLQPVDFQEVVRPSREVNQSGLLSSIQQIRTIPEPELLRHNTGMAEETLWKSGFQANLASFK